MISTASVLQGHESKCVDFAKTTAFEISIGLPRPGLARSAHRGRIKLQRGYVSKSSAGLNALTITLLSRERPRGRSRTALRGPAHQLVVRMHIIISNNK